MIDNNTWASIPVNASFDSYSKIKIAEMSSVVKIGKRIRHWSEQKKYFYSDRLLPLIDRLIKNDESNLGQLNIDLIKIVMESIGHNKTKIIIDDNDWKDLSRAEMIKNLLSSYGEVFLSGNSAKNYLKKEEINQINSILFQKVNTEVGFESIVHIIAENKDPLKYINSIAQWKILSES